MATYRYRAVDGGGRRVSGREAAVTEGALARALEQRGLFLVAATSVGDVAASGSGSSAGTPHRGRAVLDVTRALAALLPAGMPLAQALQAAVAVSPGAMEQVLGDVRARVQRGEALAAALAAHPRWFPPMYVGLVRAGEKSGSLDETFARLTRQLEREQELRSRLVSIAIYPTLLAIVGAAAITVLLLFVLPRFVDLLQGAGATLPRSTVLLLGASSLARRYWLVFPMLPVALVAGIAVLRGTARGRRTGAALLLHGPLVGSLRRDALAGRFARLLSVLLGGGAPLLSALDDAEASIGDPLAREEIGRIRGLVREGSSLNAAIAAGGVFPPMLAQLLAVGEGAGRLAAFGDKAAEIFEARTERVAQRLVAVAEPAAILVFGAMVAFVALSLLQAIYGVNAGAFR